MNEQMNDWGRCHRAFVPNTEEPTQHRLPLTRVASNYLGTYYANFLPCLHMYPSSTYLPNLIYLSINLYIY